MPCPLYGCTPTPTSLGNDNVEADVEENDNDDGERNRSNAEVAGPVWGVSRAAVTYAHAWTSCACPFLHTVLRPV